jgi:hypothetical protein
MSILLLYHVLDFPRESNANDKIMALGTSIFVAIAILRDSYTYFLACNKNVHFKCHDLT